MEIKTESVNKKSAQEFEKLLNEDFKKRDLKEGKIIKAVVSEISKKHVFVDLKAKAEGIIPIEQFKSSKELENLKVGSSIDVYLERMESHKGEIIVSREKAIRMKSWKRMEKAFKNEEEVEGYIVNRCKGGFVVSIDSCLCFLPGSQVDTKHLKNFDHLMNVKQRFLCVRLDPIRGNIVVSRKAVLSKTRDAELKKILEKIKEGDIVQGQVKALLDWGAFVDLNGVDSLLHVTDLSYSRVKKPSELLSIGQTIKVKVIKIEESTNRISVGIKQLYTDPYDDLEKKYKLNQIYKGVVTKCVEYGCFVKLEEGLEGLVHQSMLSFTNKNIQPNKVLSPSQEISVKVIELDKIKRRISLSYKDTLENPWKTLTEKTPVGSVVQAEVKNITEFALFCSIENTDLIGMCHKNDASWAQTDEVLKRFKKGSKIKARIVEIDTNKEKIRLSIRELEKDPFAYFNEKKNGDVITTTVREVLKNGIKVSISNEENLLFTIKKSHLAAAPENCRPNIFNPGNKVDCMIIDLNKEKRQVNLSIKELEKHNEKIAIKKYGKDGTSSGQVLGDILGKVFKSKKKDKKEK